MNCKIHTIEEREKVWSNNMRIYVDADACPVVKIIERIAKKEDITCKKEHLEINLN